MTKLVYWAHCRCGRYHLEIPENARILTGEDETTFVYWQCACGNTLFVPVDEVSFSDQPPGNAPH